MMTRPSPGVRRTRATAVLRRPVPRVMLSANLDVPPGVEADGLGLLGAMAVLGPGVDAQALQHVGAERVVLQHAADGIGDREGRVALHLVAQRTGAQSTRVAGVAGIRLPVQLATGDQHARGVDHDHVVAGVEVRRVGRLVLALQDAGHAARKAAESHATGVDHEPLSLEVFLPGRPGLLLCHLLTYKSLPTASARARVRFWPPRRDLAPPAARPPSREVGGRALPRP